MHRHTHCNILCNYKCRSRDTQSCSTQSDSVTCTSVVRSVLICNMLILFVLANFNMSETNIMESYQKEFNKYSRTRNINEINHHLRKRRNPRFPALFCPLVENAGNCSAACPISTQTGSKDCAQIMTFVCFSVVLVPSVFTLSRSSHKELNTTL